MSTLVINQYPDGKSVYVRSHGLETDRLSALLSQKYNADECCITPSGMAAIMTSLESSLSFLLKDNNSPNNTINLITLDEMYTDTPKNVKSFCDRHDINLIITNEIEIANVFEKLSGQINILFIEACSNPSGKIFNFDLIPLFKQKSSKFILIVDNTWLSHCIFNPFEYGADMVILSLTKYYSGGNAICGAILSRKEYLNNIYEWLFYIGNHVSPMNAKIVYDNMLTMTDRITKSSEKTITMLGELCKNSKITCVSHPYTHSLELAKKYFINDKYPSVFTFLISSSGNKVRKVMENLKIIDVKTSFGHSETSLDPWIKIVKFNGKSYVRVRIAVGHEDSLEDTRNGINELIGMS